MIGCVDGLHHVLECIAKTGKGLILFCRHVVLLQTPVARSNKSEVLHGSVSDLLTALLSMLSLWTVTASLIS